MRIEAARAAFLARWLLIALLLAACDTTTHVASAPTTASTAVARVSTALPQPSATPTPQPLAIGPIATPVERWLLDTTIHTRREVAVRSVRTLGSALAIEVRAGSRSRWERLDGSLIAESPDTIIESTSGRIRAMVDPSAATWSVTLDGIIRAPLRWTAGADLQLSPDDTSIARVEPTGPRNATVLVRDIVSGAEEVAGLVACPCDARLKLRWSSSGRYLTYVDLRDRLQPYRVIVYDRIAHTSRTIVDRNVELLPGDLAFTASDDVRLGGVAMIRLADLSIVRDFPNALEVRAVDRHLIVLGYSEDSSAVITPTGEVIARLPYAIANVRFVGDTAVATTSTHNCQGVALVTTLIPRGMRCIAGATSPTFDQSARRIAFVRGGAIVVQTLDGAEEATIATGPFRPDPWFEPALQWDESGRYLLTAPRS